MTVVRLGDIVVPTNHRSITVGIGMVGWSPETQYPGRIVAIEDGDMAIIESAPRVMVDERQGFSRFRTTLAGLRKIEAVMVPVRVGRDRRTIR